MLPPVSATSLFVDVPMPAQQQADAARMPLLQPANDQDDMAMPVSGGRLGAMSLSGQLQLAQGFSIVAETIGALLQLPRGDNESLQDYAGRISAAVQALNPADQARLEASLNQLLRGIDLRFLAEVLKDPTGPAAARLAASLELNHLQGEDLAAGAALTSYQQNGSAGSPPPAASPPAPSSAAPAPAAAPTNTEAAALPGAANALPAPGATVPASAPGAAAAGLPAGGDPSQAPPSTPAVPPAAGQGSSPTPTASAQQPAGPMAPDPADPGHTAPPSPAAVRAASTEAVALPLAPAEFERVKAEAIAVAGILARNPDASLTGIPGMASAALLAAPLPASAPIPGPGAQAAAPTAAHTSAQTGAGAAPQSGPAAIPDYAAQAQDIARTARSLGSNAVLAVVEWLADVFPAKTSPPGGAAPPKAGSPGDAFLAQLIQGQPEAVPPGEPDPGPVVPDKAAKQSLPPGTGAEGMTGLDRTHTGSVPPIAADAASGKAEAASAKPAERADPPAFALPVFVPREGVPLAFVPYPPASEQKRDGGGRKAKEVTKVDEEGEEPPPGGHHSFGQQERDESPSGEKRDQAPAGEAEPEDGRNAQDLYLRMSDWT